MRWIRSELRYQEVQVQSYGLTLKLHLIVSNFIQKMALQVSNIALCCQCLQLQLDSTYSGST